MFDATQPWLPLLDEAAPPDLPPRKAKARTAPAFAPTSGVLVHEIRAVRLAFFGVASSWALTAAEALTLLGEPTSGEAERLERLRACLGVHRLLRMCDPEPGRAAELLRQPCPALDGRSPLEVMLQDGLPGICRVRARLAELAER